jgi:hypothetical protein
MMHTARAVERADCGEVVPFVGVGLRGPLGPSDGLDIPTGKHPFSRGVHLASNLLFYDYVKAHHVDWAG